MHTVSMEKREGQGRDMPSGEAGETGEKEKGKKKK